MVREQRIIKAAEVYLTRLNVSVIPLKRVGDAKQDKRPACDWMPYQERLSSLEEFSSFDGGNIGLVTGAISGIVVVDCESKEDYEWFWRERWMRVSHKTGKPAIVKTRRGYHVYFRSPGCHVQNGTHIENRYDVRGDGGYVVAPPSVVDGSRYAFLDGYRLNDVMELPVFEMAWRYPKGSNGPQPKESGRIRNALAYIRKIRAVSGEGGHDNTWQVASILRDAEFSESEALAAMVEWNGTNCDPPWSVAELLHKVRDCYARV